MGLKRIFIYPADLVILTGKKTKACYNMYNLFLDCLGKPKGKRITVREYCKLEDVNEDEVREALGI